MEVEKGTSERGLDSFQGDGSVTSDLYDLLIMVRKRVLFDSWFQTTFHPHIHGVEGVMDLLYCDSTQDVTIPKGRVDSRPTSATIVRILTNG